MLRRCRVIIALALGHAAIVHTIANDVGSEKVVTSN